MPYIGSLQQAKQLIDEIKKLESEACSFNTLGVSAYCDCEKWVHLANLAELSDFVILHIERKHRVSIDVIMRLKLEVHPFTPS